MLKIEKKIVGSYHKTGTVLLRNIFLGYQTVVGEKIYFFTNFFTLDQEFLKNNKSLAIIRHPYEIIVSGWRYHLIGTEQWLHKPFLNGKSYVENLQEIKDIENQINFEINFCSQRIINSIYKDIKQKKETLFIKLENFWETESRVELANKICEHMNLQKKILTPILIKQSERKPNATNENFCYTWPELLTQKNIEFIDSLIEPDTFETFGYSKDKLCCLKV